MKRILLYCGGAILFVPLMLWLSLHTVHYLSHLSSILTQNKTFFICFRWLVIALFFLLWPTIVHAQSAQKGWGIATTHYLVSLRFMLTAWLIAFEVIVCENLPLTILHHL